MATTNSSQTTTVVGLMLCKPTTSADAHYTQSVPLVLWACQQQQQQPSQQPSNWTYFSYSEDSPRAVVDTDEEDASSFSSNQQQQQQFRHTAALLQRLRPIQTVHVTTELGTSSSGAAALSAMSKLLVQWLETTLSSSSSGDNNNNNNNNKCMVQLHDKHTVSADCLAQLPTKLADLCSTTASLRVAGDLNLQASMSIRKALVFLLRCQGLWDGSVVADHEHHNSNNTTITLQAGVLQSCLYLDRTAAAAIHLWPPEGGLGGAVQVGGHQQNNSILGLLQAPLQTAAAGRLLHAWLRQPLVDLAAIQERQQAVAVLVQQSVGRDAIRQEGLRLFKGSGPQDISKLVMTLAEYAQVDQDDDDNNNNNNNNKAPSKSTRKALQALYNLYTISSQKLPLLLEQVETALVANGNNHNCHSRLLSDDVLTPLRQGHAELQRSVELCEQVLDLDAAPREFLVKAAFKEELHDLQQEMTAVQDDLQACHQDMNDTWEQLSGQASAVRLETTSSSTSNNNSNDQLEWQFRLPNTNDSKLLQQQLGSRVTVHRVLKNGVYFSTKQLRQLATKKQDLVAEYDRHQRQVAMDAIRVAATYRYVLEKVGDAISLLDVLAGLAHVAAYSPHGYCRPVLTDEDQDGAVGLELKGARHPCVELQENTEYIPNDIRLVFGESSFLLVTGPNMGGKSTYIRALGAIVLMAQCGSFVPCTSAKINICHHILARVGAGDLQEKGISTFMAEMLESSSILRTATKRSLIIIDELGRGTSTFDGYGLARAISEYIVQQIGCMTVFATHFHELTALEEQEAAVQNCHVTAQKGNQGLTFLYQVKPGPCLESFGIQVAEMANVPMAVIQDAKRKAKELENFEYRPNKQRARTSQDDGEDAMASEDDHAQAEESAAALAWVNRFRRLPESVFSQEYGSDEDKRAAFMQLLET